MTESQNPQPDPNQQTPGAPSVAASSRREGSNEPDQPSPDPSLPDLENPLSPVPIESPVDSAPVHHHHHHQHGLVPALQSLFHIIVIAIFIITFVVQPFRIPSGSMEPTLLVGDFLLVAKQSLGFDESPGIYSAATIHRGEIIIFRFPVDPTIHLIKRVVGLPGDHLRLHQGRVYINGQPLTEPYAIYRPAPPDNFRDNFPRLQATAPDIDPVWWIHMHTLIDHGELIIPAGNYFVLGDNRNDSEDSRYWGFVPRANIVGNPILIYFSLQQPDTDDISGFGDETLSPTLKPAQQPPLPAGHGLNSLLHFARWHRIFHTVH